MNPRSSAFIRSAAAALLALALGACGSEARPAVDLGALSVGAPCASEAECGFAGALCIAEFPGGYCTAECPSSGCPAGSVCAQFGQAAVCALTCVADEACRNGYVCEIPVGSTLGICDIPRVGQPTTDAGADATPDGGADAGSDVPIGGDTTPTAANYGAACAVAGECTAANGLVGRCLGAGQGFPGGYCSAGCAVGIDECGAGATCITTSVGGLCMAGCSAVDGCRGGYECCEADGSAACLPDGLSPSCQPPTGGGGGELDFGASCGDDAECGEGGQCFQQIPGGYCTADCESSEDCGGDNVCISLGFGSALCVDGCLDDQSCREGQVCCSLGEGANACLPDFACR